MSQQNETNNDSGPREPEKESSPPAGEPVSAKSVRKRRRKAKKKQSVPRVQHVRVRVPGNIYAFLRHQCRTLGTQPEDLASFVLENCKLLNREEVRFGVIAPKGTVPVAPEEMGEEQPRSMDIPITRQLHRTLRDWSIRCGWTEEGVAGEMLRRLAGNCDVSRGIREALLNSHQQARIDFNHRVVIPDGDAEPNKTGT